MQACYVCVSLLQLAGAVILKKDNFVFQNITMNTHKHLTNIFCSYTYYDLPPSFDNIEHIQFGLISRPPFLIYANRQDCLNFKALETN